jgi:hypothetical protein
MTDYKNQRLPKHITMLSIDTAYRETTSTEEVVKVTIQDAGTNQVAIATERGYMPFEKALEKALKLLEPEQSEEPAEEPGEEIPA